MIAEAIADARVGSAFLLELGEGLVISILGIFFGTSLPDRFGACGIDLRD
jgi:hypothetical protein